MTHQLFLDATLPHLDVVWGIARRMSADPAGAEDLVQETYARTWRGFANQGRGDVRSWLVAICLNAGRTELRRGQRSPRIAPGFDEAPEAPSAVDVSALAWAATGRSRGQVRRRLRRGRRGLRAGLIAWGRQLAEPAGPA